VRLSGLRGKIKFDNAVNIMDKTTLVIGGSLKPHRYSNKAIRKLLENNIPVIAIGLKEGFVEGVKIEKPFPDVVPVHTVTLYVGPHNQSFYHDYILKTRPSRVIFNPGTENEEFEAELSSCGIEVVRDCTLVMLSRGIF
jgi:uncharacterized protein